MNPQQASWRAIWAASRDLLCFVLVPLAGLLLGLGAYAVFGLGLKI